MRIRQANITDASRIAEIHVRSWQAAYRGIMSNTLLDALPIEQRERLWRERLAAEGPQTVVKANEAPTRPLIGRSLGGLACSKP